jgi:hypothetical protein
MLNDLHLQVYRSVLLTSRKRRTSGSTSGSSSPVNEDKEEKEKSKLCNLVFLGRSHYYM